MEELAIKDNTMPQISTNLPVDEETLFMLFNNKDRSNILNNEISRIINQHYAPEITFKVDLADDMHNIYILSITEFGFTISEFVSNEKNIIASSFFNKDLANDFVEEVDMEFLRGMAALVLFNLQKLIHSEIEAFDMLYSPSFTEFLRKCKQYLKNKKIPQSINQIR